MQQYNNGAKDFKVLFSICFCFVYFREPALYCLNTPMNVICQIKPSPRQGMQVCEDVCG